MKEYLTSRVEFPMWFCLLLVALAIFDDIANHRWLGLAAIGAGFVIGFTMRLMRARREDDHPVF